MTVLDATQNETGQFVCTPHPVTLDGQIHKPCDLIPGETLHAFLIRSVPDFESQQWEVMVGGVVVPVEHWLRVRPKHGQLIEVRGAVNKQALYLVAMIALTYFTMGAGATWAAGWGLSAMATSAVYAGAFIAGSAIINKVLAPKPQSVTQQQPDSVYSLGASRNSARHYEPFPLLFGVVQVTPDLASNPYAWYQANDQYIGFVLNAGINVDRIEDLSNGDTLLSAYEEVTTYTAGFSGMPDEEIPQHTNADVVTGGTLSADASWVQRGTSPDTVRIQIDIEYILGDVDSKGRDYYNSEVVVAEYRPVGTTGWNSLLTRSLRNNNYDTKRTTMVRDVPRGQYDVRVRRLGQAFEDLNGKADFQWTTLVSVQADDTDYSGTARVGVTAKATGQLNGPMDEIRGIAYARSMPIWDGSAWQTATTRANGLSNPGAQILAYARGFYDGNGKLIAGIGLDDEQIDLSALQAFMLHCAANGYTYDNYVKSVRNHDEMLNAIALAGFGQLTWAGGRLSVTWAGEEQPLSGVVNMATIKRGQFQVDYTLANAADGIEYTYFDREAWEPKTLRVAAPGVTTMLNPATVSGEGVTTEAHAAELARYHLAQHLYQYKDIQYSTDLEHLSYRRLSVLALQHDLTQWGHGGRVLDAVDDGFGTVTLTLDEPVPPPPVGNAYIGLRIPGENVYRVFGVQGFSGESDTLTLTDSWPVDADLPGDSSDNPAHDTIWIYDFKQTPGYRVRVVGIEPESDLKGASVAVVPEPPEFWTYVKTGEYTPPADNPHLQTKPSVSNLQVTETEVVQGDTKFTELQVTFDVTGTMAYATVHSAYYVEEDEAYTELTQVADTRTRTARWRIPAAGTYAIVVRPYNADGIVGGVASTTYTTIGAYVPPPQFDFFTVTELDGGVRKYAFGYSEDTLQPANYAGAEIRYITGNVADPDWDNMTPLGVDGFFTSAVEMVMPPKGDWTFAARARNTAQQLGPPFVLFKTLTENLGEIQQQTGAEIAALLQDQLETSAALAQEIIDRANADASLSEALGAPEYNEATTYAEGDVVRFDGGIYRARQATTGNVPTDGVYWESLGTIASMYGANALAISDLHTSVEDVEGTVTAIGTSLVNVRASIGETLIVANPDFELEESGWQESAFTLNDPDAPLNPNVEILRTAGALAHTGSCSLKVNPPASGVATYTYNANRFAIGVGDSVSGSVRMRTHYSSPPPAGTRALIGVRWYAADNSNLGASALGEYVFSGAGNYFYGNAAIGGTATAPTGAAYGRIYLYVSSEFYGAPGAIYFDAVTAAKGESAEALASAVQALDAQVSQQGGEIEANATAITQTNVTLGQQSATITEVQRVSAQGASGNMVLDPSFEDTANRWDFNQAPAAYASTSVARSGTNCVRMSPNASTQTLASTTTFPVTPGISLRVGFYTRRAGSGSVPNGFIRLAIRWYDAAGSQISFAATPASRTADWSGSWLLVSGVVTPPAGAASARINVQSAHTDPGNADWAVDDVFVEPLTPTSAEFLASVTMTLDVNGRITGYRIANDGTTGSFDVLADQFRIISPGSGQRTEYSGGNWRVYDSAGTLRVRMGVW